MRNRRFSATAISSPQNDRLARYATTLRAIPQPMTIATKIAFIHALGPRVESERLVWGSIGRLRIGFIRAFVSAIYRTQRVDGVDAECAFFLLQYCSRFPLSLFPLSLLKLEIRISG